MRNWLRQRLLNLLLEHNDADQPIPSAKKIRGNIRVRIDDGDLCVNDDKIDLPDPINFRVQTVSGGTVVESRWYDHKKDEHRTKLHIITPDESLSDSIGKIVTMELLQR